MLQYAITLTNYELYRLTMHSHNSDRMLIHALKLRSADIIRSNNARLHGERLLLNWTSKTYERYIRVVTLASSTWAQMY